MELQEAMKTLDQVCAGYQGTRQEHVTLQQAMQAVAEALKPAAPVATTPLPEEKQEPDGNKKK